MFLENMYGSDTEVPNQAERTEPGSLPFLSPSWRKSHSLQSKLLAFHDINYVCSLKNIKRKYR